MTESPAFKILTKALHDIKSNTDYTVKLVSVNRFGTKLIMYINYTPFQSDDDNNYTASFYTIKTSTTGTADEESIEKEHDIEEFLNEAIRDTILEIVLFDSTSIVKLYSENTNTVAESPFFKSHESGEECGICTENLANGQSICVNTNCQHGFHCECINKWLGKSNTCPICRRLFDLNQLSTSQQQKIEKMGFGKKSKGMSILEIGNMIKYLKKLKI